MTKLRRQSRKTKQLEPIWRTIRDDYCHPTADYIYHRVFDVMVSPLGEIPALALPQAGFKVTSHQLALYSA